MKNKRSRFRVLLALILTVTILTLPLDTFALTGDRSDSPSAAANTATPDEANPDEVKPDEVKPEKTAKELSAVGAGTLSGDGSQDNPYIIASASDWDALADSVLDGTSYEGKIILLEEDITVTRSLGHTDDISSASSPSYEFDGTFDGGGHTLTFTPPADSNANYVAPFSIVKNATIRNLKVEGEITAFNNLSGLIGAPKGTLLVENVLVDVDVEGNFVGGFVGHGVMADMTFRSCAFTGNLNGDTLAGGFVCWRGPVAWEASGNPALHIENCLFAGTASGAADFHPIGFTQQTNVSAEISDMWATADGQNNGKGFYNYQYQGTSYRSTAATVVNGISSSRPWMGYFDVIDCPPVEGSFTDALYAWTIGSALALLTDVTTDSTITVPSGEHTLDLNGCGIKMAGNGAVIKVGSGSTLNMNDSDTGATHKFDVPDGAGLAVLNEASGTYTVNGGYITGGNEQLAGGVYIDQNGTFNMYGGCIIGNKATVHGGGVDVSAPGTKTAIFNMYGGSICYNSAPWGGGINVFGTAYVNEGCTIHHNTASNGGGGIELENGGKLYLNGSTVTENVVLAQNGGMWKGGGVHIPNGTECHLQGAVIIKDNYRETFGTAQSNVFVRQEVPGKVILDSSLTSNTPIGVGTNGAKPFTVTSAYGTYHGTTDPSKYFTSDYDDCWITLNNNGEAEVAKKPVAMITSGDDTSYYSDLSSALSAWTAGSTLKLLSDAATSSTITVPTGEHTLDLSGYELKRTGATGSDNSGLAVTVKDGVTLTVIGPGKITGGKGFHGGGIHVEGNSSLVLDNCEISGNTGHYGGGLYLSKGTITLKNGTIVKGNSASEGFGGSGIYAEGGGTLILEDSKFINNEIKNNNQYAVFLAGNANVKVSGAPVINDNTYGGMQKDLYLYQAGDQHSNVQVIGELTDGAKIIVGQTTGTGVIGSDWKANMGDVDPADYLVSADTDYVVFANKDDELEIGYPEITGVSAEGFEGDYDGEAHKISVTAPDGATIKYGTTEGSCTLTENPTYTDAGTYTVYYEVSKNKYRSTYGSATVTIYQINATVTITGRSLTVDYDGKAHSADGYDAVTSSNLYDVNKDFTFSGRAEAVRTNAGTTKMNLSADKFKNTNTNFANVTFNVTDGFLTVNPVDAVITTAPHAKSELIYNGSDQELIAAGAADGGTLYYALGDDAKTAPADESYTTAIPTATEIGNYYIWYMVKGDSNHNDLSASCIKITMADQGWGTVSGAVVDENHSPVKNATVSLIMGGRVIDEIASGSDGSYYFTVPAGIYNIVVKSSDATVTEMVNVSDRTTYDLTVPDSDTDSVLDIVDTDGNIVVGGLSKEAAAVRNTEGVSADQNVTVRMTVKTVSESDTTGSQAISGIAGDMFVEYYDCKVEKTVDTVTTSMDKTQTVLELVIPCSYTNKRELTVYNSDGSGAQTLTLSDSREAGTFRVDQNAGLVYIYTDRIATYAVGYKPYYSIKSEVSLGNFSGNVSVKLTKDTTGETYALNNVSLNSISFSEIPKGTYSMTITWTDGAENTLTTPFIIK